MATEADIIIDELGGTSAVANLIDAPISTVHSWRTNGIPRSRRAHLRLAAKAHGLPVPVQLEDTGNIVPLTQGGEAASHLVHSQEDTGSGPVPASSVDDGQARTVTCMTCGERPDDPRVRGCTFADCPHAEREAA